MQEIRVWSLVREDPTSCRVTEPVSRNYWACAPGSGSHNYWAHTWQLLKPMHPRACALQQEGPLQEEALELQWRVAPAHRSERKVPAQQWRPRTARSKNWTKKKKTTIKLISNHRLSTNYLLPPGGKNCRSTQKDYCNNFIRVQSGKQKSSCWLVTAGEPQGGGNIIWA